MSFQSEEKLITTIIPTYRRPKLLQRAIQSVLNQTYPHFQVYVCDNASGDETSSVVNDIAKKDPRVKYHCHSENIGGFRNFQFGMQQVQTPFFNLLSDDDFLLPNFFQLGIGAFKDNPKAIFFAGATLHSDENGKIFGIPLNSWKEGIYDPPYGFIEMLHKGHPEWTGIIFRKEVLTKVYLDPVVGPGGDYDFELRLAAEFPIVISKTPCAIFYLHRDSISYQSHLNACWPGHLKIIENINGIESLPSEIKKQASDLISKRLLKRIFRAGIKAIIRNDFIEASYAAQILKEKFDSKVRFLVLNVLVKKPYLYGMFKLPFNLLVICIRYFKRITGRYKF